LEADQANSRATTSRSSSSFAAGMTAADDEHIKH
jgi:hypothetical protein